MGNVLFDTIRKIGTLVKILFRSKIPAIKSVRQHSNTRKEIRNNPQDKQCPIQQGGGKQQVTPARTKHDHQLDELIPTRQKEVYQTFSYRDYRDNNTDQGEPGGQR